MPQIVNTYAPAESPIGAALTQLGQSLWGPQAATAGYARAKTADIVRQNQSRQLIQDAIRANGGMPDFSNPDVAAAVMGLDNPRAVFQGNLGLVANKYGATDARTAAAGVGAGEAYGSTGQGYEEGLSNQRTITGMNNATSKEIAQMQTDRQIAQQQRQFENTFENVYDNNPQSPTYGKTILVPRSQAAGRPVPPTKDSIAGALADRALTQAAPQFAQAGAPQGDASQAPQPAASPAAAPSGSQLDPFAVIPYPVQQRLGLAIPQQSMIEPRSGTQGISQDGGQTVILPDGRRVPGLASGFQPVSQEAALSQARDNNNRASASQPLQVGNVANSQATADAAQATGLSAWAQKAANEHIGALPGATAIINAVTGSPEIAPETQRAQSRLEVLAQQARSTLLGAVGRQSVVAQKWVNEILPQGHAFENPATAAKDYATVVDAMAADYANEQKLATDPNTSPDERAKLVQHMHQIQQTISMFTKPQQGATPQAPQAAAPQAPAAPQGRPAQITQNGFTYDLQPDGSYK